MIYTPIEMFEIVAEGLGPLLPECTFVGGAASSFYVDPRVSPEARPTDDLDCVIEIRSRGDYQKLEEILRERGFENDRRARAPLCRWRYRGVTVDLMPTDASILGFTNRWYDAGLSERVTRVLPSGRTVFLFSVPVFLATKFEAFQSRGGDDPRLSADVEDIFYVIDGVEDISDQVESAPSDVRDFLLKQFLALSQHRDFNDVLEIHVGREGSGRVTRAREFVQNLRVAGALKGGR